MESIWQAVSSLEGRRLTTSVQRKVFYVASIDQLRGLVSIDSESLTAARRIARAEFERAEHLGLVNMAVTPRTLANNKIAPWNTSYVAAILLEIAAARE